MFPATVMLYYEKLLKKNVIRACDVFISHKVGFLDECLCNECCFDEMETIAFVGIIFLIGYLFYLKNPFSRNKFNSTMNTTQHLCSKVSGCFLKN